MGWDFSTPISKSKEENMDDKELEALLGPSTSQYNTKSDKVNKLSKNEHLATVIVMVIITYFLWDRTLLDRLWPGLGIVSYIIYPLKIFTVFLHELSHGLAAIVCGGKIVSITLDPQQGGLCTYTMSQNWFHKTIIASAGYLGSMLWGCIILVSSIKTGKGKAFNASIGIVLLIVTVLWIRDIFPLIFCVLFGIAMIIMGFKLSEQFNNFLLKYIGIVSCLYSLFDIPDDLIFRTVTISDSYKIASSLGMPFLSVPIGILWMIIAILCVYFSYKIAMGKDDEQEDD